MTFIGWMALAGATLLFMALASALVRRLPISTSLVYLTLGAAIGPAGTRWLALDLTRHVELVERATELAVITSLFVGGLKLRLPLRDPAWIAARRLAIPAMLLTIAAVAATARVALHIDLASALLIGAILAPTDPVLASAVSVESAADHDRVRYGLSGEAGLNDGMAFPFVILALEWGYFGRFGTWVGEWALREIAWGVPAALAIGFALGVSVGRLAIILRSRQRDTDAPNDLLALALISLAYVAAELAHAWGFLAVFAAGVGLRRAEVRTVEQRPHPAHAEPSRWERWLSPFRAQADAESHPPAETFVRPPLHGGAIGEPSVAAGVLVSEALTFGATLERLLEVTLVVVVGAVLPTVWSWEGIALGLALVLVARPLAAMIALGGTPTTTPQRWLMGWFGVRGIGSVYYLAYALRHGAPAHDVPFLVSATISVIALSIVVHGVSAQPLLDRYERSLRGTRV